MLGVQAEADEGDVGHLGAGVRADLVDADVAGDDVVAEFLDDRGDRVEPLVALVGDENPESVGLIRRHQRARPDRLPSARKKFTPSLVQV